jgi:hypothetical protein
VRGGVEYIRACKMYEGGVCCDMYEGAEYMRAYEMYGGRYRKNRIVMERALQEVTMNGMGVEVLR